jgi:hypothetical protein
MQLIELCYCPKCKNEKKKLSCNIKKNCFKCWICDYKGTNLKHLVRRFGDFSQKHRWDTLTGEVEINQSLVDIISQIADLIQFRKFNVHSPLNAVAAAWAQKAQLDSEIPLSEIDIVMPDLSNEIKIK